MKIGRYNNYLVLILALSVLLRIIFFTGSDHSDSLLYYTYAHDALEGNFQLTQNHFSSRIGLIYPQAFIYHLFGISEFSSSIFPLVVSVSFIILIFFLGRMLFNEKTGLIAALLWSFYPLDVVYATRLIPDFPAALFMALSVFFFLKAEKSARQKIYYFLSGVSWGISYLMKEIAVLMAFFFILFMIYKKKFKKDYLWIIAGLVPLLLIEFVHAYSLTNDPFFRHSQVQSGESIYVMETYSNYFTPFGMVSRLFFHWPYLMLSDIHYGLFFIFIFMAVFYFIKNKNEKINVMLLWATPLFLYLNFGTVNLKNYVPLPIVVKFLAIISLPLMLILAYFLSQEDKLVKRILMPFILAVLTVSSIGFVYISDDRSIINEVREANDFISQDNIVYTDERTFMVLNYLSGFEDNDKIMAFNKFDLYADNKNIIVDLKDKHDVFVVVNSAMIKGLPLVYKDIRFPEQATNIPKSWQAVKEFGDGDRKITVYYTP